MPFTPIVTDESVCASAPGKLILFGEHSVVYGQPALAAALSDLRISVLVTPITDSSVIHIIMPDLPESINFTIDCTRVQDITALQEPPSTDCAALLEKVIRSRLGDTLTDLSVSALTPVLYLLKTLDVINTLNGGGLQITVKSRDLPVGAGLGSSAAFSVACTAALLQLSQAPPQQLKRGRPDKDTLHRINQYAYYSEILLHGTPSGLDNTVATYGGALRFVKLLEQAGKIQMDPVEIASSTADYNVLLVHTHVPRSTKNLVAGVRERYTSFPEVMEPLLKAMGAIAERACQEMTCKSAQETNTSDTDQTLLWLVQTNQLLLQAIGVSHSSLESICKVTQQVAPNKAAAKLTGAGGGGCAMVLIQTGAEQEDNANFALTHALQGIDPQFKVFSSAVGGDGVLFEDPCLFFYSSEEKKIDHARSSRWILLASLATAVAVVGLVAVQRRSRS